MEILSLEHYDNRAWLELLPSLADRKSYYTAFSLSIHPRDFFTEKEAAKDNEKNASTTAEEIYIRSSCKLEVVLHKFATCPFFTLLLARPRQIFFQWTRKSLMQKIVEGASELIV